MHFLFISAFFHRAQATRAKRHSLRIAVDGHFDGTDIGFPTSVGFTVGVRNVMTVYHTFSADTAFCHIDTSLCTENGYIQTAFIIISYGQIKCNSFFFIFIGSSSVFIDILVFVFETLQKFFSFFVFFVIGIKINRKQEQHHTHGSDKSPCPKKKAEFVYRL